jgi:hypothetical protein
MVTCSNEKKRSPVVSVDWFEVSRFDLFVDIACGNAIDIFTDSRVQFGSDMNTTILIHVPEFYHFADMTVLPFEPCARFDYGFFLHIYTKGPRVYKSYLTMVRRSDKNKSNYLQPLACFDPFQEHDKFTCANTNGAERLSSLFVN